MVQYRPAPLDEETESEQSSLLELNKSLTLAEMTAPAALDLSAILREDQPIEQTTALKIEEPRVSGMMALAMRRKTIVMEKQLEIAQTAPDINNQKQGKSPRNQSDVSEKYYDEEESDSESVPSEVHSAVENVITEQS